MSACTVTVDEVEKYAQKASYYGYDASQVNPSAMLEEYITKHLNPFFERHPESVPYRKCHERYYGSQFLFECGRIYGIRQERQRRKAKG